MAFINPNDPVAKGAVTRCLDEMSVRPDARARLGTLRDAIVRLAPAQFRGLEAAFAQHLFPGYYRPDQIPRIVEYLRTFWFEEATGWWPAFQPIAPIYAQGVLQALNVALAAPGTPPVPIDAYWIVGHDKVELITLANARQVTLLIATPTPPEPAPSGISSESSEAWVTARRAGTSAQEVDPTTGSDVRRDTTLRVRTFKIQTRRPASS